MKIKNKILLSLFVFILICFCFISKSFASTAETLTYVYNGTTYTLNIPAGVHNYSYYFITRTSNTKNPDRIRIHCSNEPFVYNQKCSAYYDDKGVDCLTCNKSTVYIYQYDLTTSTEWEYLTKTNLHVSGILEPSETYWYEFIYTNVDICDANGTVFFQVPVTETPETPEETPETLTTTIPALETVEQIPTAMVETLKLIIPVGLVIFGILLLILLIKSVISRMT